jgi:hypothetical protein
MSILGLDPVKIESAERELFSNLQRKCVACETQQQCLDDLDRSTGTSNFREYCPNADVLVSLQMSAIQGG